MNFLTLEQVARILQVNKMTVYREHKRGKLKAYKFGKELRIRNTDFEEYLHNAYQAAMASAQTHCTCITQSHQKKTVGAKMKRQRALKKPNRTASKASKKHCVKKESVKKATKKTVPRKTKPNKRSK